MGENSKVTYFCIKCTVCFLDDGYLIFSSGYSVIWVPRGCHNHALIFFPSKITESHETYGNSCLLQLLRHLPFPVILRKNLLSECPVQFRVRHLLYPAERVTKSVSPSVCLPVDRYVTHN
jgi:hypothetical protein